MAEKKRDINDPDFFTDENLDAIGEGVEPVDPFEGESADEPGDDPDDPGEGLDDLEDKDEGEDEDDPAPQLKDLESAKKSYNEVRARMNQQEAELQRLRAEVAAAQQYDDDDYVEYDEQHFAALSNDDPRAAFDYALGEGSISDAQTAIARMQSDAAELAAQAALARREGDQEAYWQLSNASTNINSMAQDASLRLSGAINQSQQAPLVDAERRRNVAMSEQAFNEHTGGDYAARRDQVLQVLNERPHLITGHTPEAIHQGIWDAYLLAKSSSPAGASVENIDDQVKQAIERHLSETRKVKSSAADAAQGAPAGRSAPGGEGNLSPAQKVHDEAFNSAKNMRLGARGFMDL